MPQTIDLRIGANGRLVLPKAIRDALGLSGEAKLIATLDGDEVRLRSVRHGALDAQALYRKHAKKRRAVDDFLEDRRQEAKREGRK